MNTKTQTVSEGSHTRKVDRLQTTAHACDHAHNLLISVLTVCSKTIEQTKNIAFPLVIEVFSLTNAEGKQHTAGRISYINDCMKAFQAKKTKETIQKEVLKKFQSYGAKNVSLESTNGKQVMVTIT
jgi:hypothetical protein